MPSIMIFRENFSPWPLKKPSEIEVLPGGLGQGRPWSEVSMILDDEKLLWLLSSNIIIYNIIIQYRLGQAISDDIGCIIGWPAQW